MKVKHYQGYGTVNIKKISEKDLGDGYAEVTVLVTGNHEYGIHRDDDYDFNLNDVTRFIIIYIIKNTKKRSDNLMTLSDFSGAVFNYPKTYIINVSIFKEVKHLTLYETIVNFLQSKKDSVATLKEIYDGIDRSDYVSESNTVHDSARAIIYRHEETFKRICKGVYMLKGEKATSLLIEGDGRALEEIDDNSIDCIITDHPWEDKKAHKSGNQKGFAEYDTFKYTPEDFANKARVLKNGSFLVEFLPVESSTNWEYLEEIKHMAKDAGFQYYTQCIWRNAPEGKINTGKTTKGVQQILIFSKGKPRKLSRPNVNAYQTREILNYEIEILLNQKDKVHQAEKPIALYEYLIEQLTEENEVCLDQFAGSCNMLKAAVNKNRFAICYELCHDFVIKAVERFHAKALYVPQFNAEVGNTIYKKCIELAKAGWNGNIDRIKKELPWVTDDDLKACIANDKFNELLYKNTGLVVAA